MQKRLLIFISGIVIVILILFFVFQITKVATRERIKQTQTQAPQELYNLAKAQEQKGELLSARDNYARIVKEFPNSPLVLEAQKKSEELNIKLLFSNTITPGSQLYEIVAGDTLAKIASKFNTTADLIMKSNGLEDNRIVAGRKLKVWTKGFSLAIDKSENMLLLKSGEEVFKTYVVSTGKNNSTPTGTFKITSKLPNPVWYKEGVILPPESPDNILGSRWLGFDLAGYGIHGTTEPQSIGKQATQGCVRMLNKDVEELYTILPIGTEVIIVD